MGHGASPCRTVCLDPDPCASRFLSLTRRAYTRCCSTARFKSTPETLPRSHQLPTMAEPDELYNLRNNYWVGNYQVRCGAAREGKGAGSCFPVSFTTRRAGPLRGLAWAVSRWRWIQFTSAAIARHCASSAAWPSRPDAPPPPLHPLNLATSPPLPLIPRKRSQRGRG